MNTVVLIAVIGAMLLSIAILFPFFAKALAEDDIFFTTRDTNHIKYVERGGTLDHMVAEVPGRILKDPRSEKAEFIEAPSGDDRQPFEHWPVLNSMLDRRLGIYYYGLWPFKTVKQFEIPREYENIQGTGPENWIDRRGVNKTDGLRFRFPRPFVFTDIELKDRFTVDLKIVVEFEVVRPFAPIYIFHGNFFTQAASILQGEIIDLLKDMTIEDFLAARKGLKKGNDAGYLNDLRKPDSEFNKQLVESVGLRIVNITNNDVRPDKEIVALIRQKATEEERGRARIAAATKDREVTTIEANAYKDKLRIQTEADVDRQNALATSRGNYIRQTVEALKAPGADGNVVSRGAADLLEMEAATSDTSKLTTLVKDRSTITVPVGGEKK